MRAGLSTIERTLSPETATVLNQSIAEARRRNHVQTTPLHVAATLLSSPTGHLREACIKSHPNSSHPLQFRALELCFSVALDRLPWAQSSVPAQDPPISNALMAALKRAQAHQRKGCPEQQQQPLLAVKVELEQLITSILDDPGVSRVMREASFSSPAVKAAIEERIGGGSCSVSVGVGPRFGFGPVKVPIPIPGGGRSLYVIPKLGLGRGGGWVREEEVKKVVEILVRRKKRNPVLVGDSEPGLVVKEVLRRVESGELGVCGDGLLMGIKIVHLNKEVFDVGLGSGRIGELVEGRVGESGGGLGLILDLGDLKWLVEGFVGLGAGGPQQQQQQVGKVAVAQMGKVLERFGKRVWLIGTATCETYLRCQVYHPTMENDWDLQAVPIAARNPVPRMFPRL